MTDHIAIYTPRFHSPTSCPMCGAVNVGTYELALPRMYDNGHSAGAIHLSRHGCPNGGDYMLLQPEIIRRAGELK